MDPDKTILDVFITILRSLECPVCYEYILPPIFQCNAGHILCGKCKEGIQNCPECRTQMPSNLRARKLEEISERMIYPCRNDGCEKIFTPKDLQDHEKNCPHFSARVKENEVQNNQRMHTVLLHHIERTLAPFLEIKSDKITLDEEVQTDDVEMIDQSTATHFPDTYTKGPYFMSGFMVPASSLSKDSIIKGQEKQIFGFLDSAQKYLGSHLNNNKTYNFPAIKLSESLNEMSSISNSFSSGLEHFISNGESSWDHMNNILENSSRRRMHKYTLNDTYKRDSMSQNTCSETDSITTDGDSDIESCTESKSENFSKCLNNLLDKQSDCSLTISSMKWPTNVDSSFCQDENKCCNENEEKEADIIPHMGNKAFTFNFQKFCSLNKSSNPSTKKYAMKNRTLNKLQKKSNYNPTNFDQKANVFVFKGQQENSVCCEPKTSHDLSKDKGTNNTESFVFNFNDVNDSKNFDVYAKKAEETFNTKGK